MSATRQCAKMTRPRSASHDLQTSTILETSDDDISETCPPINFTADRMHLFPV